MKKKKVVLLDSNAAVLEQLQAELKSSEDFQVLHVGDDGEEGIKKIMNVKPDIVLTGMFLKGADGVNVIQTIKKLWTDTKIMAMGAPMDNIIEKALTHGADYYLAKPFDVGTAMERIR
jgi:two-component system response regulator (stage 0 sporulation protein A)